MYKAAVIGLGRMGSTFDDEMTQGGAIFLPYCHTPSYVASPLTELVAGADPHEGQREIYGERWGLSAEHLYADYRDMLEREKPDVVSVCTTARHRSQIMIDVARAGAKAIWSEKPISLSLEEADSMVEVCDDLGVKVAVNTARRYNPYFSDMRRRIDEGELGDILQVNVHGQCGLSHNGSHAIDVLRYLAKGGNVEWVFGEMESDEAAAGEHDLQGNGYLAFDNGIRGFLRGTPCGVANWDTDVIGTEGRARTIYNCAENEYTHLSPGGPRGRGVLAHTPVPLPAQVEGMGLVIIRDLIESVESDRQPRASIHDGRQALEIAIALRESHRRGGVKVHLPLEDRTLKILSAEIKADDAPARVRRQQATKS
jgi:predicted dehydrogenase